MKLRRGHATLVLLLLIGAVAYARNKEPEGPPFVYVAGTEDVQEGCGGILALTSSELTFKCPNHLVSVPYAAIKFMEYRPDIGPKLLRTELKWKLAPPPENRKKSKKNKYFSIVFDQRGTNHALIFVVEPQNMVSYLAEIDLKAGKRVEVWGYESGE